MDTESERKEEGERSFNAFRGDIDGAVRAVIEEKMINVAEYSLPKAKSLADEIPPDCVEKVTKLVEGFKIIASCMIMPKSEGLALHQNDACLWDAQSDGHCLVRWENKALVCVVKIYGIA